MKYRKLPLRKIRGRMRGGKRPKNPFRKGSIASKAMGLRMGVSDVMQKGRRLLKTGKKAGKKGLSVAKKAGKKGLSAAKKAAMKAKMEAKKAAASSMKKLKQA